MLERETFIIITANAHKGELFRAKEGTRPFRGAHAVLLQEVNQQRDSLDDKLAAEGFKITHTPSDLSVVKTDLAIAVREDIRVVENRIFPIEKGRLVGPNHVMIASKVVTAEGTEVNLADAHPDIPLRAYAGYVQGRKMEKAFEDPFFGGNTFLGMDQNTYPRPWPSDERMRKKAGFESGSMPEPTYKLAGSRHAWLRRLGLPDGYMDTIWHRGDDIQEVGTDVFGMHSDHEGVKKTYAIKK